MLCRKGLHGAQSGGPGQTCDTQMDSIGSVGPAEANSLADIVERLEIGDELFWDAQHLGPSDEWIGHIPFALWLVRSLRPKVVVAQSAIDSNAATRMPRVIPIHPTPGFPPSCSSHLRN